MTYTILHQSTGIASEMFFDSDEQRKQWLKNSEAARKKLRIMAMKTKMHIQSLRKTGDLHRCIFSLPR